MRGLRILKYGGLLGLIACSGGSSPTTSGTNSSGSGSAKVSISEYTFSPSSVTIKVGSTVQWTNNGQLTHNVTADDASWSSGNLNGATSSGGYGSGVGASFTRTFSQVGTFTYHCSIHPPASYPGFVGSVTVTQ